MRSHKLLYNPQCVTEGGPDTIPAVSQISLEEFCWIFLALQSRLAAGNFSGQTAALSQEPHLSK